MNHLIYSLVFAVLLIIFSLLQHFYFIMLDVSTASSRPYSFARVQLIWWTFIVLSAFISVIIASGQIPTLDDSTLILLGIGSATTAAARVIDIADKQNAKAPEMLSINQPSQGFLLDLLSDNSGVSIHRLQAFIFNFVFGLWFIYRSYKSMSAALPGATASQINTIIPVISNNNLILLGLSAGTYLTLKSAENK